MPLKVEFTGKPYLVVADITVPPGVTVTVEPGVVFLFRNFTGLQVHGILLAKGTPDLPITFSSENDRAFWPNSPMDAAPYDWNGITIHESASGTTLEWCSIDYSLFGINALTTLVNIRSARFSKNGKCDLTVGGTLIEAKPQPFSYSYAEKQPEAFPAPEAKAKNPSRPSLGLEKSERKPQGRSSGRLFVRYTAIPVIAGGFVAGAWKTLDFIESDRALRDIDKTETHISEDKLQSRWDSARVKRNNDLIFMLCGYGAGVAGALGLTLSYVW